MGIKNFLERLRSNKEKFKAYKEQRDIENKYEERLKSSNERELERFMKEKREENIKKELEEFRKNRQKEANYGHQILKTKNMFDPKDNRKSIASDRFLFKEKKNLFVVRRNR